MTKWVRSVHRSPDTDRKVLLYTRSGSMLFGFYRNAIKRYFFDMGGIADIGEVKYWSEIPSKPK